MKTLILGTSGSGKSTLAQTLGAQRSAPVLHLDAVHFLPGWKERPLEQEREMVTRFLDENPSWVMDGNYTKTCMARRLAEVDQILVLYFGRSTCLYRVVRRWLQNRGRVRCSAAPGCEEKLDLEFICWVLWRGRSHAYRAQLAQIAQTYPDKFVLLRSQRQLEAWRKKEKANGI